MSRKKRDLVKIRPWRNIRRSLGRILRTGEKRRRNFFDAAFVCCESLENWRIRPRKLSVVVRMHCEAASRVAGPNGGCRDKRRNRVSFQLVD